MPKYLVYCLLLIMPPTAWSMTDGEESFTPDEIRSEFEVLYETLRDSHYDMYANRSRAEYDALFERMRGDIDSAMSRREIQVLFQRFVAYGDVAHARIEPPMGAWEEFRASGGRAFPVYFRVVDDEVFVSDYKGDLDVSVGDEVLSVDGVPALCWLESLRAHLSADNDHLAYTIMETRLPLLIWLEQGELESFTLTLERREGSRDEVEVPALTRSEREAASEDRPQLFELDWNLREARMLTNTIAYLRPGPFYDNRPEAEHPWDPSAFNAFVDQAFDKFIEQGAQQLLIDLRSNPGGTNTFSDYMVAWFADKPFRFSKQFEIKVSEAAIASNRQRLKAQTGETDTVSDQLAAAYESSSPGDLVDFPVDWVEPRDGRRFTGGVFILINRHSYSNAVSVAAIAQDFGFATILGERTADLANTYGAMEQFTLPKTGIRVGFPKARILRPGGDSGDIQVVPDIAIESPLAPSEDVVLRRAVETMSSAR